MTVQHQEPDVGGGLFLSAQSAKPNRVYMTKTADFDTFVLTYMYMVATLKGGGGQFPRGARLSCTLFIKLRMCSI